MQVARGRRRMSFVWVFKDIRSISSFNDLRPKPEPLGYLDRRCWPIQLPSAIPRAFLCQVPRRLAMGFHSAAARSTSRPAATADSLVPSCSLGGMVVMRAVAGKE